MKVRLSLPGIYKHPIHIILDTLFRLFEVFSYFKCLKLQLLKLLVEFFERNHLWVPYLMYELDYQLHEFGVHIRHVVLLGSIQFL